MTRTLPSGVATATAAETAERAHLLELTFSNGVLYLTDAPIALSHGGNTYVAVGGLIEIGQVTETGDDESGALTLQLSGVEQSIIGTLQNNLFRGRKCVLKRAYFNASGQVVGGTVDFPFIMADNWQVEHRRDKGFGAGAVMVRTRVLSLIAVLGNQRRGVLTNLTSHQRHFSGDKFFEFVPKVAGQVLRFGSTWPTPTGGSGGGWDGDDGDNPTQFLP